MNVRIVVPLDGSALAEAALPWVQALAVRDTGQITLLSVIEVPSEFAAWATTERLLEWPEMSDAMHERRRYLEEQAERYQFRSASIEVRIGTPVREILAFVSDSVAPRTLVVMSTHGYGGVKRLAYGSVALQVIHGYKGPVMTVRDEIPAVGPRLERLLIPVDGSRFSAAAIERTIDLFGEPYPQLHLVRVLATPTWANRSINRGLVAEYLEMSREWANQQLDELHEETAALGCPVTCEVRSHGTVVEEIIDAAEASGSDAIAMCTHGLGGIERIVLGSVADAVLRNSPRPVLLLRPAERE